MLTQYRNLWIATVAVFAIATLDFDRNRTVSMCIESPTVANAGTANMTATSLLIEFLC